MGQERDEKQQQSESIAITIERLPADATVVRIVGQLTGDETGKVQRTLNEVLRRSPAQLIVDLSAVTSIGVVGVNVLVSAAGIAGEEDISFCLVNPGDDPVARALGEAKMTELFEVFPTVEDALSAHRPPPHE